MLHTLLSLCLVGYVVAEELSIPNIVFVLADDQGWSDVGYNAVPSRQYQPGAGGTNWKPNPPHTPNLDDLARSPHALLFHRFYAGSAVCSPTRSSVLTGRTPDRECIFGAEGCGQKPAWSCDDPLPLPPTVFTVAEAAKKRGMATIHVGKWHLGNFFPKPGLNKNPSFAYRKWPVSNPGMHGFDNWHSTEASASSTMCNCGCRKEWVQEGKGCVIGGGVFQHKSFDCTNYWSPTDVNHTRPECHVPLNSTLDCVTNLTAKIPGDDSEFMLDYFEEFLQQQTQKKQPFMAMLWLHTNHEPHPSLPEYFYAYNDTYGKPAGDYLGTLTQMDVQIGRLRRMLQQYGVANDTLLWYTADNGPHPGDNLPDVRSATNGLRQCKASLFEGGIREPGIIEWPAKISKNRETWMPAYTSDVLPTVLEVLGVPHEHPSWHTDGESLLPLIEGRSNERNQPLGFRLGKQIAWIDGDYKLVYKPQAGQCKWEAAPYLKHDKDGPFLFDLSKDPTESNPLNKQEPERLANMTKAMFAWVDSITYSQVHESQCEKQS